LPPGIFQVITGKIKVVTGKREINCIILKINIMPENLFPSTIAGFT
jgi:hypothetical protein